MNEEDHDAPTAGEDGSGEDPTDGADGPANWPVDLTGVTESLVATRGPNGRWNLAALGLFAGDPVTATTWGDTRTRQNFDRNGVGYVQFTRDPVDFVDAALSIVEREGPILESADAWVRVRAERIERGSDDGTRWERWALVPLESQVVRRTVPTIDRGRAAVVEASIAASRLCVQGYDDDDLRRRLSFFESVVDRAGSVRDRTAFDRITAHVDRE